MRNGKTKTTGLTRMKSTFSLTTAETLVFWIVLCFYKEPPKQTRFYATTAKQLPLPQSIEVAAVSRAVLLFL